MKPGSANFLMVSKLGNDESNFFNKKKMNLRFVSPYIKRIEFLYSIMCSIQWVSENESA